MASYIFKAEAKQATTLLPFLLATWPDQVNRTKAKRWLHHKAVLVNNVGQSQFDHPVKPGDVIAVRAGKFAAPGSKMPAGIRIVHEDTSLLVIEKPSGLLSVATDKDEKETVYYKTSTYLKYRGQNERVFIVHRLDRDTSGIMVLAKTPQTKRLLQANWDHSVNKRYIALVEGALKVPQGTLRSHLDESRPEKVFAMPEATEETREAITHYKTLKAGPVYTLVDVSLETGRRNQIRVQFAEQGNPVTGDEKYGARANPVRRLALHASELSFPHPVTGKTLHFKSTPPPSFAAAVTNVLPLPPARERRKARDEDDDFTPRTPTPRYADRIALQQEARRAPFRPGQGTGRTPQKTARPAPRTESREGKPPQRRRPDR
ncbi:23S rRNA pseudouridine1911/1915/1917 synthase [Verrucomicrobium sp. GAS474]|nr:23S rRNA pseudouridine1911/1915/1917 synthase [Verrucomicrobium sp. GAS474]